MVTVTSSVTGNVVVAGQIIPSWTVSGTSSTPTLTNFIGGLVLAIDSISPFAVLDIAAGTCADSTNTTYIALSSAFTKNTAGTWVEGTHQPGMGNGLIIANSTWYHVFGIVDSNGNGDVYFDTSVTAANKPAGTTAFRRIGSFLTDTSQHIIPFTQVNNYVLYNQVPFHDINDAVGNTNYILTVPTGVNVLALFNAELTSVSGEPDCLFYSLLTGSQTDGTPVGNFSLMGTGTGLAATGQFQIMTNTSAQIAVAGPGSDGRIDVATYGYVDFRGQ